MSIFNNKKIGLFLLVAGFLLVSCGTSRKQTKALSAKPVAELTPEQQRKYDYFFLEAARLKIQKDYDAAFDLLQHCLTINPNASSALYELAQYYLFLKQVPQGQAALEKAVKTIRIIIGTVRDWRIFISNRTKGESDEAAGRYVHTFHRQAGSALCLVGHL